MAGYRQDAFTRLVGVSWATGGLVAIGYRYAYGVELTRAGHSDPGAKDPREPQQLTGRYDAQVDIPGLSAFPILGSANADVNHLATGGDKVLGGEVANPITIKMLEKWAIWQRADPFEKLYAKTTPGFDTWIVDTASWQLVYNAHITSRSTAAMSKEAALNQFKGLIGSTGYEGLDPNLMGVLIAQQYVVTSAGVILIDPPYPPTPEGYAFWGSAASQGWSGHMENSGSTAGNGKEGAGIIFLNIPKLKALLPDSIKSQKTFEVKLRMGKNSKIVRFQIFAESHDTKKTSNKNFPLGTEGWLPNDAPWDGATSAFEVEQVKPSSDQVATIKIQFNPTRVLSLDLVGDSGIEIG